MEKWYRKDLGSNPEAEALMSQLKNEWLAMEIIDHQASKNAGVFRRLNLQTGLNELYFTPTLKTLALAWGAEECDKPGPSPYRIGLLCGVSSARNYHFADQSIYRR